MLYSRRAKKTMRRRGFVGDASSVVGIEDATADLWTNNE